MTPKKAKEEEVLQNVPVEEAETPVEPEVTEPAEEVAEPTPVEETPTEEEKPAEEPAEEEPKKAEKKNTHVTIEEPEYKHFSAIKAPEEIRKILEFYGVTSKDIFDGNIENMGLKKDELKAVKEWYATLI